MTGRAKWWENEAHVDKHAVQIPHSASRPAWQRSTQLRDALQQLSPRAGRGHAQVCQVWLIEQLQRLQVDLGISEFRGEFAHAQRVEELRDRGAVEPLMVLQAGGTAAGTADTLEGGGGLMSCDQIKGGRTKAPPGTGARDSLCVRQGGGMSHDRQ